LVALLLSFDLIISGNVTIHLLEKASHVPALYGAKVYIPLRCMINQHETRLCTDRL